MSAITEFFGYYTKDKKVNWKKVVKDQFSRYTKKKSIKVRKSQPETAIGTVVIKYGKEQRNLIVDPERFLENGQVFLDCIHLLTNHEPGNELHLVPEVKIPGGNVDFFLVSVRKESVRDFVGIELQALDTTGSLWAERQKLLIELGLISAKNKIKYQHFGINWKMTAKTTLIQLHHKVATFEHLSKKFVLVLQNDLLNYMTKEFNFDHLNSPATLGDSMHFHSYKLLENETGTRLELDSRISTDNIGLAKGLGLRAQAQVELEIIVKKIESRISPATLFNPVK